MNLKFETVRGCARPPTGTFWSSSTRLTQSIPYESELILTAPTYVRLKPDACPSNRNLTSYQGKGSAHRIPNETTAAPLRSEVETTPQTAA